MTGPATTARPPRNTSRRTVLRSATAAGMLLAGGVPLAACGRQPVSASAGPTGPPRRGGRLRVGMVGAGKGESFDPSLAANALINTAMSCAVFDPLLTMGADGRLRPMLATSWASDSTASVWTFRLRQGVTWHDGTDFTSADVLYSLKWMAKPGNGLALNIADVDLDKVSAQGPYTVVVPLKSPNLLFPYSLATASIVRRGAEDFTRPVGTGPFSFVSLDPGQQAVCKRNPAYWDPGKPYLDELVFLSVKDDFARLNALLSGQTDVMAQVPFTQAKSQLVGDVRLIRSPGVTAQAFYMAIDKAPFDDVRVRRALRLIVDRRQLVDVALFGFGTVGNDLYGKGLEYYDDSLPQRTRDLAKAKALLAEAGHGSGLTLQLQTSTVAPGMVEAATLFQQQAKDAGVDIDISQVDPTSYFDPTRDYLKMPFAQTLWQGMTTLGDVYNASVVSKAPYGETHWSDRRTDELVATAVAAPDAAAARSAWAAVQRQQYDSGGYIWWGNVDNLDAVSNRVGGLIPNRYQNLGLPTGLNEAYFAS